MAHNSRFWRPGDEQHPPLSRLSPGECTHQGGGFSYCYFLSAVALPKAVEWIPVPSLQQNSLVHLEQRGRVFTPSPSLGNPYTIQFSRYYRSILSLQAKSGNTGTKAT